MKRVFVSLVIISLLALALFAAFTDRAEAYSRYNGGCQACHGSFTDAVSTKGSVIPGGNKHEMHRSSSYMAAKCDLCHSSGDGRDPFIGSSTGTANNPGLGCSGCHEGTGLRAHHAANGVSSCALCHTTDPQPQPENAMPVYYGTADTRADNPCNLVSSPKTNENWTTGDFIGIDNDGDNLYDFDDPDCQSSALPPAPDIKANGSDGPVTVPSGDSLVVTVELSAGDGLGSDADWWLVAETPFGYYHYVVSSGSWAPGIAATSQGALFDLGPYEVLNMAGLSSGPYVIHFGVDTVMNGRIDMGSMFSDDVSVSVMK